MFEDEFVKRLKQLGENKKVSANDMSIEIGQSNSYISSIERGRNFPTMQGFFYICEYLGVSPSEFFDFNVAAPNELSEAIKNLHDLNEEDRKAIIKILKSLNKH